MFASVSDPDYPGHVILEQFQAQVKEMEDNLLFNWKWVAVLQFYY